MGLLDDLVKSLEEAQRDAERRRRGPIPATPRDDRAEADLEDEADGDDVVVRRAPPRPVRRHEPPPEPVAPEPPPQRTVASAPVAEAPHTLHGVQSAERIRGLLGNRQSIRDALILREILGPPPGLRRRRR